MSGTWSVMVVGSKLISAIQRLLGLEITMVVKNEDIIASKKA